MRLGRVRSMWRRPCGACGRPRWRPHVFSSTDCGSHPSGASRGARGRVAAGLRGTRRDSGAGRLPRRRCGGRRRRDARDGQPEGLPHGGTGCGGLGARRVAVPTLRSALGSGVGGEASASPALRRTWPSREAAPGRPRPPVRRRHALARACHRAWLRARARRGRRSLSRLRRSRTRRRPPAGCRSGRSGRRRAARSGRRGRCRRTRARGSLRRSR